MAKRVSQREVVSAAELPPDVIGAVVLADLSQIETSAATHPDPDAQQRIIRAAQRLRYIAEDGMPTDKLEQLRAIAPDVLALLDPTESWQQAA